MKSERRKAGFIKMLLLVMTLAVFMPVSANAAPKTNQWVNKGGYRYYYNQKGKKVKNKVKQIGKFGHDGYRLEGCERSQILYGRRGKNADRLADFWQQKSLFFQEERKNAGQ